MSVFRPNRTYRPELDIRLGHGGPSWPVPSWIRPPAEASAPNGETWLVVMGRRAGKTWLARGLAHTRPEGGTLVVDLRSRADVKRHRLGTLTGSKTAPPPLPPGTLVVVDEPALGPGGPAPADLAAGLRRVRESGAVPLVLLTPAEHALLLPHLSADAWKDVIVPPVLDEEECARMAARAPDWAPHLVARLREAEPAWLHTPFLLELVLGTGEEHPGLRGDLEALTAAAVEEAEDRHEYVRQWFHDGLGPGHRAALRAARWRAAGLPVADVTHAEGGAGERAAAGRRAEDRMPAGHLAEDPVLARHLPEVLRVHHISDLHHGGSLRDTVDAKDGSQAGRRLAALAGAGTPMDSYLDHLRRLAAQGRAPHLVVVTGDVVNRPQDDCGRAARAWLAEVAGLLAPHRDLRDEPRVLLVGGNHDVSWDLALDPSPQARHRWFAEAFADYPHPDLQEADPARRTLYVAYPRAGLRFALLGTAESGGEVAKDTDRERLGAVREAYLAAGRDADEEAVARIVHDFERLDPGVVDSGVLDRLAAQEGYVTVAALHHPLSPVPAVEVAPYSGVVNAGVAKRALAGADTSLVLHGHTHLAFAAAERFLGPGRPWTMRIAGAPALASRETDERNGYNELFVAREGTRHALAVRTVRLDGGRWTGEPVFAFRPGAAREHDLADLCRDAAD
ncbi:metallophosphoesterase [Streptomyces sp. HPF1205]|uniref:metallophosphoesterase family protein n=1 Tax=Streptomyces sp. HPF1205 TaxID=2873262 RepID=UPI001CEDAB65|nr:metallophosphoesterase family protein [Streptomyces sp. HPF1205]